MPNWTHNIVSFKGQTPETFAKIISYITDSENNVDFDKIIPAPNTLFQDNVPSASNIENYLYTLRQNNASEFHKNISKLSPKRNIEINDKLNIIHAISVQSGRAVKFEPLTDEEKRMLTSFYETGYFSWYDWNTENWGTKWNASDTDIDTERQRVEFDTAWDMPRPIFQELANKFDIAIEGVAIFEDSEPETIYFEPENTSDNED